MKILDYGSGKGGSLLLLRQVLGRHNGVECIGYDIERYRFTGLEPAWVHEVQPHIQTTLPQRADIVVSHFALHHTQLPISVGYEIRRMNPKIVVIADFDFREANGHVVPMDKFVDFFKATEMGREELCRFQQEYGQAGNRVCYSYHMRYGMGDFVKTVERYGYEVVELGLPSPACPRDKYKFLLVAERARS